MSAESNHYPGPSGSPPGPPGAQSPSTSPNANHSQTPYQRKASNGHAQAPIGTAPYTTSPVAARRSFDRSPPNYAAVEDTTPSSDGLNLSASITPSRIVLRKLPSTMNNEALVSMMLFAEDFVDAKFITPESSEDAGFQTAIARFRTIEGATEARNRLNGRLNATNDANMVVEMYHSGNLRAPGAYRRTSDGLPGRQLSTSASSGSSNGTGFRHSSRYSGTFQSLDNISPTKHHPTSTIVEGRVVDGNSPPTNGFFNPQSPITSSSGLERARVSGKSVINDDAADDETGELLRDPLGFAQNGHSGSAYRTITNQQYPVARMGNLHLNTDNQSPPDGAQNAGFTPARTLKPLQSPIAEFSPTGMPPMSPTGLFSMSPQFQRTHYPPANPADQNPPCNTLYVGNLPVDASEDELKALFSKQRGYKRLCFRTKHNGPMCFVEFEDITFATKALNELYGTMLHNSVKGGIRLSFSKNPLGVRAGQGNGMGPTSPLGSPGLGYANGVGAPPGFSIASGPPPGLSMPPGLSSPISMGGLAISTSLGNSKYFVPNSNPLSPGSSNFPMRTNGNTFGVGSPNGNSGFPDYMLGR